MDPVLDKLSTIYVFSHLFDGALLSTIQLFQLLSEDTARGASFFFVNKCISVQFIRPYSSPRAELVSYTAVFSVVTQRSSPPPLLWEGAWRDDSKNGCVAEY